MIKEVGDLGPSVPKEFKEKLWDLLFVFEDDDFNNGRTAAYWHLIGILDNHVSQTSSTRS